MTWSESGKALPPFAYTQESIFDKEAELLQKEWFCVGRVTDYEAPGKYRSFELAGQPLLVWRGDDGEIRAFENVCRHRMSLIADAQGESRYLSCPFHGWTYQSTGHLVAAPQVEKSLTKGIALPEFKVETWLGFVFVNCDRNAKRLAPNLTDVEELVANHGIEDFSFSFMEQSGATVAANWKLMMEIGLESYHFPFVHAATLSHKISGSPDAPAGNGSWTVSVEPRKAPLAAQPDDPETLTDFNRTTTYTFGILPNTVFNIDVDNCVWFSVLPISADQSTMIFGAAARNEHRVRPLGATEMVDMAAYLDWAAVIGAEDNRACERVQKGLKGKHAHPGQIVRHAEHCLYEMHQFLESRIPNYPLVDGS